MLTTTNATTTNAAPLATSLHNAPLPPPSLLYRHADQFLTAVPKQKGESHKEMVRRRGVVAAAEEMPCAMLAICPAMVVICPTVADAFSCTI